MPNLEKRKEQEISDPIELRDALVEAGLVGSLVKEKINRDEIQQILGKTVKRVMYHDTDYR